MNIDPALPPAARRRAGVLLVKAAKVTLPGDPTVPPLGLLYLASVLRQAGYRVRVLDLRITRDWQAALQDALRDETPALLGISALTAERNSMKAIARAAKALHPDLPVLVGGAHPTSDPTDCFTEPAIDAALVGEGEAAILELVGTMLDGGDPAAIKGVYTHASPPGEAPPSAIKPDLERLPLPAWDLVPLEEYFRRRSMSTRPTRSYAVMSTSRGCPYRCEYCHENHGKTFRARSPEAVADEVRYLTRTVGGGTLEIVDDIFNLHKDRSKLILRDIAREGAWRTAFPNGVRGDLIDDETLDLFAACRTPHLSIAVETASPRLQREIRKHLNIDKVRAVVEGGARRGIYMVGFFILGLPTETRDEMLATVSFARETPFDAAYFFKVLPFPGTGMWERLGEAERGHAERELDGDSFRSTVNMSAVSDLELAMIYRLAHLSFYGRPSAIWRIWKKHPSRLQLLPQMSEVASILLFNRAVWIE
jgi:radical SAM superfamily enzyme YgiQ (UPF0313 family)